MGSLIHVTAWERVSTGRRLLCAFARVAALIALLLAVLLAVGSVYYRYRYPLTAKIWHWKHGYSTTMGNYEVPVAELERSLITERVRAGLRNARAEGRGRAVHAPQESARATRSAD